MLASRLARLLSAALVHAGSDIPTTDPDGRADRPASGLALPLPGGTWCIGQSRGVPLAGRQACVGFVRLDPTSLPDKTS